MLNNMPTLLSVSSIVLCSAEKFDYLVPGDEKSAGD